MIRALYLPANPHRYPSIVNLDVSTAFGLLRSPEVERLLGERPEMPVRTDTDAALVVGELSGLRDGGSLNERATSYRKEVSMAAKTFTADQPAYEGVIVGDALAIGWVLEYGDEGPDYVPCDCPDRIVSYAMSFEHDEVVDAHRGRLREMRAERVPELRIGGEHAAMYRTERSTESGSIGF